MSNSTLGSRLREERKKANLTQTKMGEPLGVSLRSQISYEKDEHHPNSLYFQALHKEGFDVYYIISGLRMPTLQSTTAKKQVNKPTNDNEYAIKLLKASLALVEVGLCHIENKEQAQ